MATLLCFGYGYCAEHFIVEFGGKFESVIGTMRRAERAGILNAYQAGAVRALVFDGTQATREIDSAVAAADYALISIPPDRSGDPVLAASGHALAAAVYPRGRELPAAVVWSDGLLRALPGQHPRTLACL